MEYQVDLFNPEINANLRMLPVDADRFQELLLDRPDLELHPPVHDGRLHIHQWHDSRGYVIAQELKGNLAATEQAYLFALPSKSKIRAKRKRTKGMGVRG